MDAKKLKSLIKSGETQGVEFKAKPEAMGKSLCAFANTNDGVILVGVADDGRIVGTPAKHDDTIANVAHSCKPAVYPDMEKVKIDGKLVFIVTVRKSEHIHAIGNIAYKRVGTHDKPLSPEELLTFAKSTGKFQFDLMLCKDSAIGDIDWKFVESIFIPRYEQVTKKPISGTPKELLVALGCIKSNKPTNAGILLFGKNPQKFFMNAYVALARYKGDVEGPERRDYKEFEGNLFQQIDAADEYIKGHIAVMSRLHTHKVEREDIPEYGWYSVRELVTNAVCHRDYSEQGSKVIIKMFDDRIEFYNPGGLIGGVTEKNIAEQQFSKNPVIANVLSKIKYIEELGEGWNKIIEEHQQHPLKPRSPLVQADEYTFMAKIFSTKESFEEVELSDLNERQKKALDFLKKNKRITNSGYQTLNSTSRETAKRDLSDLVTKKFLKQNGRGRGVFYTL